MTTEENTTVETNDSPVDSAEQIVEAVEGQVEDIIPEEDLDDDFLNYEDEDGFFWVIQRAIWGVLKSFMILLVLGGVLWWIWGFDGGVIDKVKNMFSTEKTEPAKSEVDPVVNSKRKTDLNQGQKLVNKQDDENGLLAGFKGIFLGKQKTDSETKKLKDESGEGALNFKPKVPVKKENLNTAEKEIPALIPIGSGEVLDVLNQMYDILGVSRTTEKGVVFDSVNEQTVDWLVRVQRFAQVELQPLLKSAPADRRAPLMIEKMNVADQLIIEGGTLSQVLNDRREALNDQLNTLRPQYQTQDGLIFQAIGNGQSEGIEALITNSVTSKQKFVDLQTQLDVADNLQKNVDLFLNLMRKKTVPLYLPPTEI